VLTREVYDMWKFVFFSIILAIFYNILNEEYETQKVNVEKSNITCVERKPRFIVDTIPFRNGTRGSMESVAGVLYTLGYEMSPYRMDVDTDPEEPFDYDWDVLWTYYHWRWFPNFDIRNLKLHQKLQNHPGLVNLIRKHFLSMTTDSKYVLQGFMDHAKLKEFAEANPEKRFVQKLTSNKGIVLKNYSEIVFKDDTEEYFAQEFLESPLLIDGHMFDFGIYTLITSVDPLRVYYYTENCVLRFSKKPYDPNNFNDTDTYVIDYDKTWNITFPPFHNYSTNSFSSFYALRNNLKKVGIDPDYIFEQVEDCISSVFSIKEKDVIEGLEEYEAPHGSLNFFTLVRCDFVINSDGKLHLIEVNQSPNIGRQDDSYDRFKNMYRSMIRNVLDIVGVGPTSYMSYLKNNESNYEPLNYIANDVHISTDPDLCLSDECKNNCESQKCKVCIDCMDDITMSDNKITYLEHMNMKNFKRVHPRPVVRFEVDLKV
jgi:tubulin monoglycylase TTLL15